MDSFAQRFDAINTSVERQARVQSCAVWSMLGFGGTLVLVIVHNTLSAVLPPSLLWLIIISLPLLGGMMAYAYHPRLHARIARGIADSMVMYQDPLIMTSITPSIIHPLLAAVLRHAGICDHPNALVLVAVHFHNRDSSGARMLEVRVGQHDVPNIPREVYAALALLSSPGGRWAREEVTPISYLRIEDPKPSAHARLRWQQHILARA